VFPLHYRHRRHELALHVLLYEQACSGSRRSSLDPTSHDYDHKICVSVIGLNFSIVFIKLSEHFANLNFSDVFPVELQRTAFVVALLTFRDRQNGKSAIQ
jgi:hypothetical protein